MVHIGHAFDQSFSYWKVNGVFVADSSEVKVESDIVCHRKFSLNDIHSSKAIATDFVNGNDFCIILTQNKILIIDTFNASCLQVLDKEIMKAENASISFPYIVSFSVTRQAFSKHKLNYTAHELQCSKSKDSNHYIALLPNNSFLNLPEDQGNYVQSQDSQRLIDAQAWKNKNKRTVRKICRGKVNSSGYGEIQPRLKMGQGPSVAKKEAHKKSQQVVKKRRENQMAKMRKQYPMNCSLLTGHQPQNDDTAITILPGVTSLSFDPYGEFLATAHNDNSLHILRLPFSKYRPASKQISDKCPAIESKGYSISRLDIASRPSWSHSQNIIAFHDSVYSLSPTSKNVIEAVSVSEKSDCKNAIFFSRDKVVMCSSKEKIYAQPIRLEVSDKGKEYSVVQTSSRCMYSLDPLQHVLSIAAVNEVNTNFVACSCSDKSLHILDPFHEKVLWSKPRAAGSKPAHAIAFPHISFNNSLSPDYFNLLATASIADGGLCMLWDLRSGMPSGIFKGHVNRFDRCMVSFSPCMRYIAVGSEGACGSAALYDLRGGRQKDPISRLGRSKISINKVQFRDDTITDVQFNPTYPQIVTGSLSGRLRWYTEEKLNTPPF